jgi:hypothetical protein
MMTDEAVCNEIKALTTGSVLTITTGIVMVEKFAGVGEAFEWIMGHPVWTHEMPSLGDEARNRIVAQFPDIPTFATSLDWRTVLADAVARYGETIDVRRGDARRTADPVTTAIAAMGDQA